MRVQIDHITRYTYSEPADGVVQLYRMTPRATDGQQLSHWRIDVDADGRLFPFRDAHGNAAHIFYADGPVSELAIHVRGAVTTADTNGIVSAVDEPLPPSVYLRSTDLTTLSDEIAGLAQSARREGRIATLHNLMMGVHGAIRYEKGATSFFTSAATALVAGTGVCQDMAQIFITAARHLGIPSRYVAGHFAVDGRLVHQATHAWVEAWVPDVGWIAFDPTHAVCGTENHIRVAVGLDSLDAAPVRGSRRGGGSETLDVSVHGAAKPNANFLDIPGVFARPEPR